MHLFKHKRKHSDASAHTEPIVTYHITQSLSGTLAVTPTPSSHHAYSITLTRLKNFRDTIDVAIKRSVSSKEEQPQDPETVGHCRIEVVRGKFLECRLGDGTEVTLESEATIKASKAKYKLSAPSYEDLKWVHDADGGGRTTADRKLKLVDADGVVIARFAGSATGLSEFGLLEVYEDRAARDIDWCGLVVLSAVCVYAREERNREKNRKAKNVAGFVGTWGGLLSVGIPVAGA